MGSRAPSSSSSSFSDSFNGGEGWEGKTHQEGEGEGMFARIPGKGITLEMYIRNTQVNKKMTSLKNILY